MAFVRVPAGGPPGTLLTPGTVAGGSHRWGGPLQKILQRNVVLLRLLNDDEGAVPPQQVVNQGRPILFLKEVKLLMDEHSSSSCGQTL